MSKVSKVKGLIQEVIEDNFLLRHNELLAEIDAKKIMLMQETIKKHNNHGKEVDPETNQADIEHFSATMATEALKPTINFTAPNFEEEWGEAERYPTLFKSKEEWLEKATTGKVQDVDCSMDIQNTDMCDGELEDLHPEKVKRARQAIEIGQVELPIVLKTEEGYNLLGGNTRLTALHTDGYPTKAWVIDMTSLNEDCESCRKKSLEEGDRIKAALKRKDPENRVPFCISRLLSYSELERQRQEIGGGMGWYLWYIKKPLSLSVMGKLKQTGTGDALNKALGLEVIYDTSLACYVGQAKRPIANRMFGDGIFTKRSDGSQKPSRSNKPRLSANPTNGAHFINQVGKRGVQSIAAGAQANDPNTTLLGGSTSHTILKYIYDNFPELLTDIKGHNFTEWMRDKSIPNNEPAVENLVVQFHTFTQGDVDAIDFKRVIMEWINENLLFRLITVPDSFKVDYEKKGFDYVERQLLDDLTSWTQGKAHCFNLEQPRAGDLYEDFNLPDESPFEGGRTLVAIVPDQEIRQAVRDDFNSEIARYGSYTPLFNIHVLGSVVDKLVKKYREDRDNVDDEEFDELYEKVSEITDEIGEEIYDQEIADLWKNIN